MKTNEYFKQLKYKLLKKLKLRLLKNQLKYKYILETLKF